MTRSRDQLFETLTTVGALLPSDFLQRLAQRDRDIPGLTPDAYHLGGGERINEAISRSWNRLLPVWKIFAITAAALPPNDLGTTLTREKWLLPLFQELGYGRLPTAKPFEFDGRRYAISHAWQITPIHVVSFRADLDTRSESIIGARTTTPHSMMQEFLNRSEGHQWGIVSNGYRLRLLRDNASLTRQAYVEFDLEAMMQGEAYADFALLWLLLHQSRVEGERPELCWLEKWTQEARQRGARALDQLRDGVEQAITALGSGFLAHPANAALREKLNSGTLTKQDYFRQLLRIVYRLLFLFVAEDRELLFTDQVPAKTREQYLRHYSLSRLRRMALRLGGTQHADLWQVVRLVFRALGAETGCPSLGLPALGSFLWSDKATPDLNDAHLANRELLQSIRALAYGEQNNVRRPIDYKNIGSEELGSVYESLLEQHPDVHVPTAKFTLGTHAGHERKTTGSYYTPPSLVQCLLDSALEPVLIEACKKTDPEQAILNLKICDPACGSGHFLIAAAHRIARRLASVRTGEDEPAPSALRHALRDVIGRCIYGVDINPMAVELCKFALWLEAVEPGKPLSFLDHHIQCGNSLIGATPALMHQGIPDKAFDPIEGDDRKYCAQYKKANKEEATQMQLFSQNNRPWEHLGNLAVNVAQLTSLSDATVADVQAKERRYAEMVRSSAYESGRQLADAWCAAFVWKKCKPAEGGFDFPITNDIYRRLERNPRDCPPWMREEIRRLAERYQFFHWHLAFPNVFQVPTSNEPQNRQCGWRGGFDVILGNPPWERVNVEAKQFFAALRPDIAEATTAQRRMLICHLESEHPSIYRDFQNAQRQAASEIAFFQGAGFYQYLNQARLNTYVLFVELAANLGSRNGRCGLIVPSGIATDDVSRFVFNMLISQGRLVSLYDFENRQGLFPSIDSRMKFCVFTFRGDSSSYPAHFSFFLHNPVELGVPEKSYTLSGDELRTMSPTTGLCPTFRTRRDKELVFRLYSRAKPLVVQQENGSDWAHSDFLIMFRSDDSSHLYRVVEELQPDGIRSDSLPEMRVKGVTYVPVWESKLLHQFDHRYATFQTASQDDRKRGNCEEVMSSAKDKNWFAIPRYWAAAESVREILGKRNWSKEWLAGYRDITNSTNERTAIAAILPQGGAAQPLNLFLPESASHGLLWVACMNSFALDYVARQRIGGVHLNITTCRQLPVIGPQAAGDVWLSFIQQRALELIYTSPALEPFARDFGYDGPPFRWDEERRFLLRCELDAAFFHLYGIACEDVDYIMETFPIVKRKDEAAHGHYRTKDTILEIYDALAEAQRTGQPYATHLKPLPASIRAAHPFDWTLHPLTIPQEPRVPFSVSANYAPTIMLEMLYQSGGVLEWEILRKAWRLLSEPDRLAALAQAQFGDLARQWRRDLCENLLKDDLVDTLSGFCHDRTLRLRREKEVLVVELCREDRYTYFPHVRCDARLALVAASTLPPEPEILDEVQSSALEAAWRQ